MIHKTHMYNLVCIVLHPTQTEFRQTNPKKSQLGQITCLTNHPGRRPTHSLTRCSRRIQNTCNPHYYLHHQLHHHHHYYYPSYIQNTCQCRHHHQPVIHHHCCQLQTTVGVFVLCENLKTMENVEGATLHLSLLKSRGLRPALESRE